MRSSTETEALLRRTCDGVLTLTLNRPSHRNAIDAEMRGGLATAIADAGLDPEVRAVVLTGGDGDFCAGGDVGSFGELRDPRAYRQRSHLLTETIESLERLEKPVVAAIDGVVVGAGLALALACDWRIAAPGARFLFREGRLGLIPSHGGLSRSVQQLGLAAAKEALLGGDDLDARGAHELGLVSELVADATELAAASERRVGRMLLRAPLSFAAAKRVLQLAADTDLQSGILAESLAQMTLLQSRDHEEGLAARSERRPPNFTGR